jgi:hypothetical protein
MPLFNPRKNLVLMDGYYPPDYFYDLIIGTLQYLPPKSISTMCSHTHTVQILDGVPGNNSSIMAVSTGAKKKILGDTIKNKNLKKF